MNAKPASGQGYLAIVNPAAGGGRCGKQAPEVVERLREAGLDVEVKTTREPGEGISLARRGFAEGYRNFIAGGGDGTSFEVINGFFPPALENEEPVRLGFLPLGTGNAFLQDFTKERTAYALHCLIDDQKREVDVVALHHSEGIYYFINLIGFGLPADVTIRAAGGLKRLGAMGYILGVFLSVAKMRNRILRLRLADGTVLEEPTIQLTVSNSRFTANGMLIAPRAELQDGKVDVVSVAPMGRIELLRCFPTIFRGTHIELDKVSVHQSESLEFLDDEEIELMIDGEIRRIVPRRITVCRRALEVWA